MNDTAEIRSYIEAPRWAGFPKALKQSCWDWGLELEMEVDRGWLRETVYYKITGPRDKLKKFNTELIKSLQDYNENRGAYADG